MVVGVGIVVAAVKSGSSGGTSGLSAAAQRLGLRYEHTDALSNPTISGTRRGLSVTIDTFKKSEDFNRQYTRYRVNFKEPLGLGLRLMLNGPGAYISRKLGSQDIETGDDDFDSSVIVKGRDPQVVREFLTDSRKLRAVRFLMLHKDAIIDDKGVEFSERDVTLSPDRIVQTIQSMTALAESFAEQDDGHTDYLEAMKFPDGVATDDHSSVLPERVDPWPITLDELVHAESAPEDTEEQANSFFEEPEACGEPEHDYHDALQIEVSQPAETADSVTNGTDIESVVQALFAQGHSTSQTAESFETEFTGKSIEGFGLLTNVRSYRFDLVFGDMPGTRIELELIGADTPSTTDRPVKAVVQFPADAEDRLRALVDSRISFRGVLKSCDAFMKTLFLTNGELTEVRR